MVLALCGRQSGKSTSAGGLGYDDFSQGKTVILTAPSLRQSTELFRRILEFKNTDPFCPPIVRQTQTELEGAPIARRSDHRCPCNRSGARYDGRHDHC